MRALLLISRCKQTEVSSSAPIFEEGIDRLSGTHTYIHTYISHIYVGCVCVCVCVRVSTVYMYTPI
jgi:hypothetical protein